MWSVRANARSYKTHGAAGQFYIDLPLTSPSTAGVESRNGGVTTLELEFTEQVTLATSNLVISRSGLTCSGVTQPTAGVAKYRLALTGSTYTDGSVSIMLKDVRAAASGRQLVGAAAVYVVVLDGDADGNGSVVDPNDYTYVNGFMNQAVSQANCRCDMNLDGTIGNGDMLIVQANLNTSATCTLPPAPLGLAYTWDAENRLTQVVTRRDPAGTFYLGDTKVEFVAEYDANGNVGQVLDATNLSAITTAAKYEYDPYGNTLAATGTYAAANPFRFSTKWFDTETGLSYYGYRYYSERLGRWMSRDPIGELGGLYLIVALANNPLSGVDFFGLALDSPSQSFIQALASGNWAEAWLVIQDASFTAAQRVAMKLAFAAAVAGRVAMAIPSSFYTRVSQAWHVVRPEHRWCQVVQLVQNTLPNAVQNMNRVSPWIQNAWNQGALATGVKIHELAGQPDLFRVTKQLEVVANGARSVITVVANVDKNGIVTFVDAWVTK